MSDDADDQLEDPPISLFGDPRSSFVQRGPERRVEDAPGARSDLALLAPPIRHFDPGHALRTGRGDGFATMLMVLGVLVFGASIIAGSLILYNAKNVGAFSNPWDSTRVAIGVSVLAVGVVHSVLLIGLSRVTSYLLAILRMRARHHELHD